MTKHIAFALVIALAACGDDASKTNNTDANNSNNASNNASNNTSNNTSNNGGRAEATFLTYNIGLARGFVDYAAERAPLIPPAIAALDADVVCLQEVWTYQNPDDSWSESDIEQIIADSADTFPHSYWQRTTNNETVDAQCTSEEADPLLTCVIDNGCDMEENVASCALANCGDEFSATSSECQTCMAVNISKPIDEILSTCTLESAVESFNGHNGLLLLSKHPLANTEHTDFEAVVVHRSALRATVAIEDHGDVDVYCTHFTADLTGSGLAYPMGGTFSSYEEEQAAQVDGLRAWADENASEMTVFMGDFNTGPDQGDNSAELPANYTALVDGYTNHYLADTAAPCTFCPEENPLVGGMGGKAIDHVLFRYTDPTELVSAARVFDEVQSIETTNDGPLDLPLSDHYGVVVTVR